MRSDGLKLCQRMFGLGIREYLFSKRAVLLCTAAQAVWGSPSLGVFHYCGDVELRDVGWGWI